jgi:hypothetical protein
LFIYAAGGRLPSTAGGFMQNITPFLWFNGNAKETVNFYVSVFKNSRITHTACCTKTLEVLK